MGAAPSCAENPAACCKAQHLDGDMLDNSIRRVGEEPVFQKSILSAPGNSRLEDPKRQASPTGGGVVSSLPDGDVDIKFQAKSPGTSPRPPKQVSMSPEGVAPSAALEAPVQLVIEDPDSTAKVSREYWRSLPLEEEELLEKTAWCLYCCCFGIGVDSSQAPVRPGWICKCCCCREQLVTGRIGGPEGLCSLVNICCCCTAQCQVPPLRGSPRCALCDWRSDDHIENHSTPDTRLESVPWPNHSLLDLYWLAYCCIGGCGISKHCRPCFSNTTKCLCCTCRSDVELLGRQPGPPCMGLISCLWLFAHCRCAPLIEETGSNPICACCGWRVKKAAAGVGKRPVYARCIPLEFCFACARCPGKCRRRCCCRQCGGVPRKKRDNSANPYGNGPPVIAGQPGNVHVSEAFQKR